MKKNTDLLLKTPLFSGIRAEEMEAVLRCLDARKEVHPRGTYIRSEGDAADFIGILLSGSAQVVQDDYFGDRSILTSLEPGEMFGEAFACAGESRIPVSILASLDTEVLMLSNDRILQQEGDGCGHHAILIRNLLHIVARKNLALSRKMGYMAKKKTAEKLMAFLKDQAKKNHSTSFTIPFDRQGLADYLGVDRSAMSFEIGRLRRQGRLKTERSHFELLGE